MLQFFWTTECLTLHPELPSGCVKSQQLQQHKAQCPQRQMANALVVAQSLANVLGKCQFVVYKKKSSLGLEPTWPGFELSQSP